MGARKSLSGHHKFRDNDPETGEPRDLRLRDKTKTQGRIRINALAALYLCALGSLSSSQPVTDPGSARACASSPSSLGVSITSCVYTLSDSPAHNPNYYVKVTIVYAISSQSAAVRFRCDLGNGTQTVSQFGVSRSSPAQLTFISPFVTSPSPLTSVACAVDQASAPS